MPLYRPPESVSVRFWYMSFFRSSGVVCHFLTQPSDRVECSSWTFAGGTISSLIQELLGISFLPILE